ncbi:MAG TPA: hypothetical protein DCS82_11905 [Rhodospirillaceae bacterium]|nr:hypothetical protein [Rhodospirillaceae bacterium]HAT36415.1 hypothetical protein [Rhodospirillaceae bacterium]
MTSLSISFAPLLPLAVLIIAGVAAGLVVLWGLVMRATGAWFRVLAAAFLFFTLLNPAVVQEERELLKDVAAVVVDDTPSANMGARREAIQKAAAKIESQIRQMNRSVELRVLHVRQNSISEAAGGSKLIGPLQRALSDVPARRVAGAILITDGQVHDIPAAPEKALLPKPMHILLAGKPNVPDRSLIVKSAPSFGLVSKEHAMVIRVDERGTAKAKGERDVRVVLRRDGGDEEERLVPVGRDYHLPFKLEHAGPTVFELEVLAGKQELTTANNRAVVAVNGVRDRLRVLLVSGEPYAGERTWRNLLKSDPSVDLVHFTILRPPEKNDATPINELSLIAFPVRQLFKEKLEQFDLVVFDRYRRRSVLPRVFLGNIVRYVRKGGAFMVANGPAYATTSYSLHHSPLRRMLPGKPAGQVIERGFRPKITKMGFRHPVTAELPGGPESRNSKDAAWGRWFRLVEIDRVRGRTLMTGIENRPLLILNRFGKGRTAQLSSDQIWLWARGFEGGGPQAELLRRLAHWLMKEPALEEDSLTASVTGDTLHIERRSIEAGKYAVKITAPDGSVKQQSLKNKKGGRYSAAVPVNQVGLYRISEGNRMVMAAAGPLNPLEIADVQATDKHVRAMAKATGGTVRWIRESGFDVRLVPAGRKPFGRSWLGLSANENFVVTGIKLIPLLPALLALLVVMVGMAIAWRREGA